MAITVTINGEARKIEAAPDTPLLWVIRDELGLTGTKFGCGAALCGACSVHLDGEVVRSCQILAQDVDGRSVTTIEGARDKIALAVKAAWNKLDVAQCGYCQSGQIMSAIGLLSQIAKPTDDDIDKAMDGNVCRCCTYHRIRAAIHEAAHAI
ncbi:MAG: (2Fe-2S)-binding protein [Hyphomicrobiaceae bacterium]